MSFAKILVPVTGADRDAAVLAGGFAAAKLFDARVEALFVRPDPVEAMPFYGEGMSSGVVQEIMDVSKDAATKASKSARSHLEAAAKANDAPVGAKPAKGPSAAFSEIEGNFQTQVTLAARLADLVVFGPVRENDRPGLGEAFDATLLETGRPVLLNAGGTSCDLVSRIAVAWNGSVASAHAVSAALPFLKKAKAVDILIVGKPDEANSAAELIDYLALHGVSAAVRTVDGGNRPVADVLLEAAKSGGAGLLVAGGYGHNRIRELFVTGTTKRVVAQTTIPCFLVH
jgi:nucleotide-binding universal stress UspA family protein